MLKQSWPSEEAVALASAIILEYTGMSSASQLAFGERVVPQETRNRILDAAARASAGEPLQYITGYTEFCGIRITVEPGVLIPRPETEEMTSMIIRENPDFKGVTTDLCTGSGCIAIALSLAFPDSITVATDYYPTALEVASRNINLTGARVRLLSSDIFSKDISSLPMSNIIVSNPPYVTESEKGEMHVNVLDHEPHQALFVPDNDPLLYYRAIADIAAVLLLPGGVLWLEVNETFANETAALLPAGVYRPVQIIMDIRGKSRFIKAERDGRE